MTDLLAAMLVLAGPLVRLLWAPLALCGLLLMALGLHEAAADRRYADAEVRAWQHAHGDGPLPAGLVALDGAATARLSAARFRTTRFALYLAVGGVAVLLSLDAAGWLHLPPAVLPTLGAIGALALLAIMASEIAQEVQGRRLGAQARRNWHAAGRDAEGGS